MPLINVLYLWCPVILTMQCKIVGWSVNQKGCANEWSWPYKDLLFWHQLEWPKITMKNFSQDGAISTARDFEPGISWIPLRSETTWANFLSEALVLHVSIFCFMIWYDMIWYDMIWYDIWYDMIWYDMIWYGGNKKEILNWTAAAVPQIQFALYIFVQTVKSWLFQALLSEHMCCSQGNFYVGYRIWLKCISPYEHVSFRHNCTALQPFFVYYMI